MTWQARLPAKITKYGNLMITAGPCLPAYPRDHGMSGQYSQIRMPLPTTQRPWVRDGDVLIADGPFAETKEQVAGYDVIECADLDEAMEVASRHPTARLGTIEVRPFMTP